jgi:hypothetical protein
MSLLTRQLALGADAFLFRYPHCWLVWEAGGWSTPARDAQMNVAETLPLTSGLGLELGRVRLVFHDAKDFRRRVSTVPLRAPPAELSARRRP